MKEITRKQGKNPKQGIIEKKSKIADKCNKHFTNAGTAFASKIPKLPKM